MFCRLGLNPTEAIRLFYHQIYLCGGLPFPVRVPNAQTRAVLARSRKGKGVQSFNSIEDMFASW